MSKAIKKSIFIVSSGKAYEPAEQIAAILEGVPGVKPVLWRDEFRVETPRGNHVLRSTKSKSSFAIVLNSSNGPVDSVVWFGIDYGREKEIRS